MTKIVNDLIPLLANIQSEGVEYSHLKQSQHKKDYGQFFTDAHIAEFMSNLFSIDTTKELKVLDCGAGNGMLSVALLSTLIKKGATSISLNLFEVDEEVIPMLQNNLQNLVDLYKNISISFNIINENFILFDHTEKYDCVISNPPYYKLNKNSVEAEHMDYVVHGQPNIYMLFMAKSAELLKDNGEMVFITPRSFTSGLYFKRFRAYLLENVSIANIHNFHSRKKHFKNESILQETIITKMVKTPCDTTTITTSEDSHFTDLETLEVSRKYLIDTNENIIRLPSSKEDLELLDTFFSMQDTFSSMGYKISTGKVVIFRSREFLSMAEEKSSVPMLYMNHFKDGTLHFPIEFNKAQYIACNEKSMRLLIPCDNYIVVKRFSSKEQKKRINIGYIFKKDIDCEYLGLENHLNYVYKANGSFSISELKKLGEYLSSEMVDRYFRLVNGNTQVNASEIASLPIPKDF